MVNFFFVYWFLMLLYLCIVYYDDYILVVDKFSGLFSVFGKVDEYKDVLIGWVNYVFLIVIVVYCLDMVIFGIMVMVLNKVSYRYILK